MKHNRPDLMTWLVAAFGLAVLVTLMLPVTTTDTEAAPASELQAGIIFER